MNEQERITRAAVAIDVICKQYGVTVKSQIQAEQLGEVLQIRGGAPMIVALANWQPTPTNEPNEPKEKNND